jgi:DNA invertase Pin-like site-specific DNA recombinase
MTGTPPKGPLRVAAYRRVSTAQQVEEGYGLDAQTTAIKKVCAEKGWDLVQDYVDEGKSGGSMKGRDSLLKMLKDAQTGAFDLVMVWSIDRLSRDDEDFITIKNGLKLYGVRMGEVGNPTIDFEDPYVEFIVSTRVNLAKLERKIVGIRTRAAMDEAGSQGLHLGRRPLAFTIASRREGGDGKLHPNAIGKKVIALLKDDETLTPKKVREALDIPHDATGRKASFNILNSVKKFLAAQPPMEKAVAA